MTKKSTPPKVVQKQRASHKSNKSKGNNSKKKDEKRVNKGPVTNSKNTQVKKEDSKKKPKRNEPVWSKSKKKRMRLLKAKQAKLEADSPNTILAPSSNTPADDNEETNVQEGLSSLQKSFQDRLSGSRFRVLNEELYTQPSWEAFERFQANPELFDQYHAGYRKQTEQWPTNPVHVILQKIEAKSSNGSPLVVADFGCGDAEIAKRLNHNKSFVVHSFDLVAKSEWVTACDMSKVPLGNNTVDIAVFCLSLMGTNLADFVREAFRVLKKDGQLYVAEVRSRFESKQSNDDLLNDFLKVMENLGFECMKTDRKNKMFFLMEFQKNGKKPDSKLEYTAKACIYKRR